MTSSVGSPAAPPTVERAFQIWIAALVVYLIYALVSAFFPPSAADYVEYFQSLGLPAEAAQQAYASQSGAMTAVRLVFAVIFLVLFGWFGMKMRAGANWARIVNVVIAVLGVLGVLITGVISLFGSVPQAGGVFGSILQVISGLLFLAFLWFAFQGPTNAYFRSGPRL